MINPPACQPLFDELDALYEDSIYSATTYFEAAKAAEFWGKLMILLPALISACAGFFIALGGTNQLGTISAVAGAVAAIGAFLGTERKAPSYKDSARLFTRLRHNIRLERRIAQNSNSIDDLETVVRSLRAEYNELVLKSEPTPNRLFRKAQKRISEGVMTYSSGDSGDQSQSAP